MQHDISFGVHAQTSRSLAATTLAACSSWAQLAAVAAAVAAAAAVAGHFALLVANLERGGVKSTDEDGKNAEGNPPASGPHAIKVKNMYCSFSNFRMSEAWSVLYCKHCGIH
jgi:hydroxymethylglutaryl-CoA reductase